MVNPVPGYVVNPPYKKPNNGMWNACGWHTGQDYAAPYGTSVVAARAGTVFHVDYGGAFGGHQFVVRPGDGTEDFYAHMGSRPGSGAYVGAGAKVGVVDAEGNCSGPHLHFERHSTTGLWTCSVMDDPMKSHNAGATTAGWLFPDGHNVYAKYLEWHGHEQNDDGVSDSIKAWQEMLNHHSIPGGEELPVTGQWFEMTADETRLCQRAHVPPEDPYPEGVFVGEQQFEHVKHAIGCPYVWVP